MKKASYTCSVNRTCRDHIRNLTFVRTNYKFFQATCVFVWAIQPFVLTNEILNWTDRFLSKIMTRISKYHGSVLYASGRLINEYFYISYGCFHWLMWCSLDDRGFSQHYICMFCKHPKALSTLFHLTPKLL